MSPDWCAVQVSGTYRGRRKSTGTREAGVKVLRLRFSTLERLDITTRTRISRLHLIKHRWRIVLLLTSEQAINENDRKTNQDPSQDRTQSTSKPLPKPSEDNNPANKAPPIRPPIMPFHGKPGFFGGIGAAAFAVPVLPLRLDRRRRARCCRRCLL